MKEMRIPDELITMLEGLETKIFVPDQKVAEILKSCPVDEQGIYTGDALIGFCIDDQMICAENHAGSRDVLLLVMRYLNRNISKKEKSPEDILTDILTGKISKDNASGAALRSGLHDNRKKILAFFSVRENKNTLVSMKEIIELFPKEDTDRLLCLEQNQMVLIREISEDESLEDIAELAEAFCETAENEEGIQLNAGIVLCGSDFGSLPEDLAKAEQILKIGQRFEPDERVWIYEKMLMERVLNDLDPSTLDKYRSMLFSGKADKWFNDEMQGTVNTFFKCDLNLSDTARQMFIHRNTLMYRLDKIQKMTGLDLRKFKDAVVFRILMDKPAQHE